jgi:hypothetical protein
LLAPLLGGTVSGGEEAGMGHVRLGVLPKSRKWRQVVNELRLGAEIDAVAASAADAAEAGLWAASNDPAFLQAFWLLTQVPLAARGPDFAQDLRHLGVQVSDQPSLMDVVAAISVAVSRPIFILLQIAGTARPSRRARVRGAPQPCKELRRTNACSILF